MSVYIHQGHTDGSILKNGPEISFTFPKVLLQGFALGNVTRHSEKPFHLPSLVAHRKRPIANPANGFVGANDAIFLVISAFCLASNRRLQNSLAILGVNGIQPGAGRMVKTLARVPPDFFIG